MLLILLSMILFGPIYEQLYRYYRKKENKT